MSQPSPRYKCDECGAKDLERQFYIWRREDLDDPEAFDIEGAEPTDMGSDYWCKHCDKHTFGEEYDGHASEAEPPLSDACPVCKANDVEGGPVDIHEASASQPCYCVECEASWTSVYKLAENIEVTP